MRNLNLISLEGRYDNHIHCCPHINKRSLNIYDAIKDAEKEKMAAIGLMDNFSITSGNYRRKKSGTTDLPIKYRQLVKEYLYNKFTESNFEEDRKKFFIKIKKDFLKDLRSDLNRSFNFEDFTIFLSKTEDEMKFRIKKKSKTNGPTVIFSIDFHNNSKDNDLPLLNKIIKESK